MNAVVAETTEEARRRALPERADDGRAAHRRSARSPADDRGRRDTRGPGAPPAARRADVGPLGVGTPDEAAAQVTELATTYGVDEVMLNPVAGATRDTARDRAPYREETLRLLAAAFTG